MSLKQKTHKTLFRDIASSNIVFCHEDELVTEIARKMRDNWIDTIFVQNAKDEVVGIITDGIIWNLIAQNGKTPDPRTRKAKEIMFKNFIRVNSEDPIESLEQLQELFARTKVQRIGLIKDGKIVGLIPKKFIERVKRYSRNFSFTLKQTT